VKPSLGDATSVSGSSVSSAAAASSSKAASAHSSVNSSRTFEANVLNPDSKKSNLTYSVFTQFTNFSVSQDVD
jgi:hypothetical protein